MRACIYARYSTERQRETSITDQVRVCAALVTARQWDLVAQHADEGESGSTLVASRSGGAALLAGALASRWEVLVLEGLDRLSRDLVEQETIVRRLEHRGIRIVGVSDGYDSQSSARKLHRGMRGIINEVYLDDLRAKTHRGLAGQITRGFSGGGAAYGYRSVATEAGHLLEVDAERAHWVRWIFARYAAGASVATLAHELNRQGVPSPRGGTWAVSALYGSPAKGSGILNNETYIGRMVWNRSQWVKDPDSKRRQRLDRPRSEWIIRESPELRIVDDETWALVRDRLQRPAREGGAKGPGPRPKTLFGGLLVCGHCGGAVVAVSARAYGCAARKDRGPTVCEGVLVRRDVAERRLLAEVREMLLAPDAIAELRADIARLAREQASHGQEDARAARTRLAAVDAEIARLVDAIAAVGVSEALRDRLQRAEAERAALKATAAPRMATVPVDADAVVRAYRELVVDLQSAVETDMARAREILRDLLGRIVVSQEADGTMYANLEVETTPAAMAAGASLIGVAGARFTIQRRARLR